MASADTTSSPLHPDEILGKDIPMTPSPHPWQIPTATHEAGHWQVYASEKLTVLAASIVHTVPTLGYLIQESPTKGRLKSELAIPILQRNKTGLGMKNPLPLLSKLKAGETLVMPDGTVMRPEEFVEADREGRRVVILGDTSDPSGMDGIVGEKGCDVLVHEATNACLAEDLALGGLPTLTIDLTTESDQSANIRQRVKETTIAHGHSTPEMAGEVGKRWKAKRLLLNHFSSRYSGGMEEDSLGVMEEIRRLAVGSFGSDEVVTVRDFMVVTIPRKA
ncbi:hypothetical protein HDU67_004152 [Dinochytrium kinnereticum]|nr:hypothetical protein HDU67_004152 [Dinochytrium kinnereticum]